MKCKRCTNRSEDTAVIVFYSDVLMAVDNTQMDEDGVGDGGVDFIAFLRTLVTSWVLR
jgi:hypothetical protein